MPIPRRPANSELLLSGAIALLALLESLTMHTDANRELVVAGYLALAGSVAWRVTAPFVPVLVVVAVVPLQTTAGLPVNAALTTTVVIALAAYSAGAHLALRLALPAAALLAGAGAVSVLLDQRTLTSNLAFAALLVLTPWGVGVAMRARQQYVIALEEQSDLLQERAAWLEQRSAEAAAAAVAEERARIARDLHDIVAHSLTVMGLQAAGVRRRLHADQSEERTALLLVEQTGRQAQDDMRHLLTLLRTPTRPETLTPQPGLAELGTLLATARGAGLTLDCRTDCDSKSLPAGVDLAAYRIVQEALTNVRRHSNADHVTVVIECGTGSLRVTVTDNGTVTSAGKPGHGLAGMRERAALYGGTLDAGPLPDGGFRVVASLSFRVEQPA